MERRNLKRRRKEDFSGPNCSYVSGRHVRTWRASSARLARTSLLVRPLSRGSRPSLGGPNSPVVMEHSGGSSLRSRSRVRRHAPLAIAGAAALLAVAGFASRSTSDEPRRLSEIGNCLTSSSCPDVWEPVCAAAADHPNKANASTFELNSTHLYTYASACIAAECGTAVVQARTPSRDVRNSGAIR